MNKKKIWIITIFPEYFKPFFQMGVIARAKEIFEIEVINLRDYALNNYGSVDDSPYGGGPGMVMRADVLFHALEKKIFAELKIDAQTWTAQTQHDPQIIDVGPRGSVWNNERAHQLAMSLQDQNFASNIVFLCGRYEGIDERFLKRFVHQSYSLGDFVISGGELAVMSMLDSALRFLPGVLGNQHSASDDSFEDYLLGAPCYTKPKEFFTMPVPEVLTNGNHAAISSYQLEQKKQLTRQQRPDLYSKYLETKGKQ